ncbi:mn2+ homeostasis protein [Diplodia corticola]|uniref:Mn2+ homeostasis protein n=1 Tax=Diplodia corticola TaxID=236234 RepID=A0A1J9RIP9_9PEZI|nr:mn2+ homeostasis protein [Diplodia corticola]OJD39898.1 mn2+ homeostasis protein [Diplodia corticola]
MDHRESAAHDLLAMSQEERLHSAAQPRMPSQETAENHSAAKSDRDKYQSPNPPASSITPPPSSQVPPAPPSRTSIRTPTPTPPTPVLSSPPPTSRPSVQAVAPALVFTLDQINGAAPEELRDMAAEMMVALRESRTSAAHHKLQYNMLCMDSVEAQNRMAVELAMAQREVEVLQQAEERRRNDMTSPHQSIQQQTVSPANATLLNEMSRHIQILQNENEELRDMLEHSRRVTERREGEIAGLVEENDRLRGRIRKNRDHLNGILGDVYDTGTPMSITSTPRYPNTPRSRNRAHTVNDPRNRSEQAFEALLLADKMLSEKNTTAPTTPTKGHAPKARFSHTRGAQSLSSMPATPNSRSRPSQQPSTIAVPRTPPSYRPANQAPRSAPAANVPKARRRESTDSTITASSMENAINESDKDTEIDESQASQMASNMLRRTPQHYTMGGSPHPSQSQSQSHGNRGNSIQAKLFGQVRKPGVGRPAEREKRSISGVEGSEAGNSAKRSRVDESSVGLGIGGVSSSPKRS